MKKTKERRAHQRTRVIFGAQTKAAGKIPRLDCVVRNFSEGGACVELKDTHKLADDIALTIPRKGRQYAARVIWSHENAAGLAFGSDAPAIVPDSELEQRLRATQRKVKQLRQRVKDLSGVG